MKIEQNFLDFLFIYFRWTWPLGMLIKLFSYSLNFFYVAGMEGTSLWERHNTGIIYMYRLSSSREGSGFAK